MSNTETIFNPVDNSLEARVRAYYSVCQAFTHSQASLRHTQKVGEVDYLGDEASIKEVYDLASSSLKQANAEVSQDDLRKAKQSGLISSEEFTEITQVQRAQKLALNRQSQSSQSHQIKR